MKDSDPDPVVPSKTKLEMSLQDKKEAFVTLATNDTYSLGCLVLGNSLRRVKTTRQLVVMVSVGVSNPMRSQLAQVFDVIQEVDVLDSNDPINLSLLGRPDLNVTFTKLHCWRLTQFDKAVFLDADTLVLQNVDELFDREELSAAPDAGWPDCFNSGVFVFKPSLETYQSLLEFATSQGSFDGGDQGLLNMYFKNWATEDISKHLPFIYNVVSQAFYSYLPAFTQFKDRVKIVHFIGAVKPWHHTFDTSTRTVQPLPGTGHSQEFLQVWWNIFMDMVQPNLDPSLALFAPWPPPVRDEPEHSNGDSASHENVEHKPPVVEETIPVVFPYKPPDVGNLFYEVDKDDSECNGTEKILEEEKIVEMTVIPRSYSELESHYAEEPISHINPSKPPPGTFSAPWITEGWEKGMKGPDPKPPDFTVTHKIEESKSEALKTNSEPESKENSINETEKYTSSSPTNNEEENSSIGLAGELATMTVHGAPSPATPLSDAQRKLNWERGQIDYLGQDSFENIQKKIDETLNTSEPAPTPVTMASPFTPKSATNSKPRPEATSEIKPEVSSTAAEELPPPIKQPVKKEAPQVKPTVPAPQAKSAAPAPQPKPVAPAPQAKSVAPAPLAKPAAPAPQSKFVAPTPQVKPVAPAPQAKPVAPAPQPKPAAPAPQPKPSAPVTQPKPSVSATQPKSVPATQPKSVPATQPTAQPKVTPVRPLVRPQTTSTAQSNVGATAASRAPAPSVQSRFGATTGTARPAAPTQPATKTTGLNIQTSSKKK
ncbi:glycogenin-2-like isoform X2 [Mercenaria mercenaria]|uniref:glycogenin-2-like isoform X2 n=1 Tax=Mercenaria mercenaria TaxID=6596 RepID=UPI00234F4F20|nr:glycogenin-2-like isoform X2 [Mercenaria mercenaria]